jgi:hypothetical protein
VQRLKALAQQKKSAHRTAQHFFNGSRSGARIKSACDLPQPDIQVKDSGIEPVQAVATFAPCLPVSGRQPSGRIIGSPKQDRMFGKRGG